MFLQISDCIACFDSKSILYVIPLSRVVCRSGYKFWSVVARVVPFKTLAVAFNVNPHELLLRLTWRVGNIIGNNKSLGMKE